MANNIAKIEVLESLLKTRYHPSETGNIDIGNFWSILQIYFCIRTLGISIVNLCDLASMISGRIDAKYQKTTKKISHLKMRKYLHLQATPSNIGHTVVTKTVGRGSSKATMASIKALLERYNTYGPDIMRDISTILEKNKGDLISTKATTMGMSDFNAVLSVSILLIDMHKTGFLDRIAEINRKTLKEWIIKQMKNYNKKNGKLTNIGFPL